MAAPSPTLPRGTRIKVGTVGSLEKILLGPAAVTDGSENLVGALRQSMAALGARTIREMQQVEMVYAPAIGGRRQVLAARPLTAGERTSAWSSPGGARSPARDARSSRADVRTAVGFVEDDDGTCSWLPATSVGLGAQPARQSSVHGHIEERTADYTAREVSEADRGPAVVALILKYGTPAERLGRGPVFRLTPDLVVSVGTTPSRRSSATTRPCLIAATNVS